MAEYVRFQRGSRAAYQALLDANRIDNNTLYFIYPEDNKAVGELYLGTRIISGGDVTIASANLDDLADVIINETGANSFLVRNANDKWESKSLTDIVALIQDNLKLSADVAPAQVFQTDRAEGETDIQAIVRIVNGKTLTIGDIAIIRVEIANGKYQHTAYVYDGSVWAAMDGNYNAENVYFNNDFTFTKSIGVIDVSKSEGSKTVEAKGKNIEQFLASIFAKEEQPSVTAPSVSLNVNNAGSFEVGTKTTPTFSASLNAGSYTYGPATGVVAKSWSVTSTAGDSFTTNSGTCKEVLVTDGISYNITATASYDAGAIAKTNIGNNSSPVKRVEAGSKISTAGSITGYRKTFYGTTTDELALTSDAIRGLASSSSSALSDGSTFDVVLPIGAKRVVIAYPATLRDISSIKDDNGLNAEIVSAFTPITMDVEGANGYDAITYDVYTTVFADPLEKANIYHVTI